MSDELFVALILVGAILFGFSGLFWECRKVKRRKKR